MKHNAHWPLKIPDHGAKPTLNAARPTHLLGLGLTNESGLTVNLRLTSFSSTNDIRRVGGYEV